MMSEQPTISYRDPQQDVREPAAWLALLLCVPGALCWTYFLAMVAGIDFPEWSSRLIGDTFWPTLWAAVGTALISIIIYARLLFRRLRWYVVLNLSINIPGLIFTGIIFTVG